MTPAEYARAKIRLRERGIAPRISRFAWQLTEKAMRHGVLPKPEGYRCVDCHEQAQTYDHRFYSRPLEVEPVCRSCNKKRGSAWDLEMLVAEAA
jgi:5-methylcytosine-specific restriction endonuclease McrA